jgi:hypothetical protein
MHLNDTNPISQFNAIVDAIYGVYLDSNFGFTKTRQWIEQQQKNTLSWLEENDPQLATLDYLDQTDFIHGTGDPNHPESRELHRCTQHQYKERNTEGGANFMFIGNMSLVAIYQYWEDHYRLAIAEHLGTTKNELKEPIMGDIRHFRRSIIHHAGVSLPEMERCKVLRWFKEGDTINIDKDKFEIVIFEIKNMVHQLTARALQMEVDDT